MKTICIILFFCSCLCSVAAKAQVAHFSFDEMISTVEREARLDSVMAISIPMLHFTNTEDGTLFIADSLNWFEVDGGMMVKLDYDRKLEHLTWDSYKNASEKYDSIAKKLIARYGKNVKAQAHAIECWSETLIISVSINDDKMLSIFVKPKRGGM